MLRQHAWDAMPWLSSPLNRAVIGLCTEAAILCTLCLAALPSGISQARAGGIYTTCAVLFLFSECSAFDEGFRAKALDVACELVLWVSDIPAPGHPVRTVMTAAAAPLCLGCAGRFLVAYRRLTRKAAEWWLLCDTANSLADCTWAVAELCGVAEPHPVFGACSAVLIAMAAMLCLDAAHEATRPRAPKRPKAR